VATSFEVGVGEAPNVVQRVVEIVNEAGLHARPVMQFVDTASRYQASIQVHKGGEKVDGKSPMEMMLLEAPKGSRLHIVATGSDAEKMVEALAELIASRFGED
jgi:phosphocarrier protein